MARQNLASAGTKELPMIPIHELLSRIRWDKEFGSGDFEIGYYDRVLAEIIRVPFAELIFPPDNRNSLQIMDYDGVVHSVPLHRITAVYTDPGLTWHREH